MSSLPPICHHVSWPVLKISLLITASASFFTPINGIFHIDLIIVWACHGQRISFPGSFSNAWSKKLHVHVNVWIKEHHLVFMPTSVTRWWTLWIIFGQIVLHCSNHLMNVNISIIAAPGLTSSWPSSSTLSDSFSLLCLCQSEQSRSCQCLDLSRLWRWLRLKLWGHSKISTWSCRRQTCGPSWPGQ